MTNANGREMLEAIRQFSHFYKDCALLLKTGEAAFMGANWKNIVGNTAIANLSRSIEWPEYWPPYYAFRYFKSNHYPSLVAFLSIIFDLPEKPDLITEPLISAGFLDYGKNEVGVREHWYATLHAWTPNRQDNGMIHVMDPQKEPDNSYEFSSMKTLAVPLISIGGAQDLKDKVIQPIFNEISKSMPEIKKGSNH